MSQDRIEFREPHAFRLRRLDLVLAELARPTLEAHAIGPSTRERLADLGIALGSAPCRRKLIQSVWNRKRDLMQKHATEADWSFLPPSA
jgi:hypothetical protein